MQYALENIVALINRKEPLPVTFTRALANVTKQALHRGIYPIEVQELFSDLRLELPRSYFEEPEGIIKSEVWYKVVRILERAGISVVPISVPSNLSIYQSVYLLKRPDITTDQDIATLQRLVRERKARHTNGELEIIARAKEKLSNYNIMLRVFEFLGSAQVRLLDANQRSVLQTILDQHPLPHDGMRYVRSLYSYACDIGSYHYDYSDPKLVLPQLPPADNSAALDIVARTIAPSHQAIKIPENFPYRDELAADYRIACPKIFTSVESEEAPRRPLSLRPLSEINCNQRQRRLEQRLERMVEPLRAAASALGEVKASPMVQAIEDRLGTVFSWEDQNAVALARKLKEAKLKHDEQRRLAHEEQEQQEEAQAATLAAALAAQEKSRNKRKSKEDSAVVVSDAAKIIAQAVRAAAAKKSATAAENEAVDAKLPKELNAPALPAVESHQERFDFNQYADDIDVAALKVKPEQYLEDLKGALPSGVDSEQVAQLMMVKGVRLGFSPDFIAKASALWAERDPELTKKLTLLAAALKNDDAARLMLPDFHKSKLAIYSNDYPLEVAAELTTLHALGKGDYCALDLNAEARAMADAPLSVDGCRELLQQAQNSLYEAYLVAIAERFEQEQRAQHSLEPLDKKRKGARVQKDLESKSVIFTSTKRKNPSGETCLVDPSEFKVEWSGERMGHNFDYSVNQLNENKIAFARWVNFGDVGALQRAISLGALERFHLVPWVWDELSFLHHSYLVWSPKGDDQVADALPDLNQDYGANLKLFVQNPFKQKARLDQVLCFELILRPLFAQDGMAKEGDNARSALQLLELMHYNISAHQSLDLIPAAFYHGLICFERYLRHPEEHVNLERFYIAVARANPYAFNLFITRLISHFGAKLSAIPEQFFELIVLNLVLFVPKDQGASAQTIWRLLKDESFSKTLPLNVIALRAMARALYCLVRLDRSLCDLELIQVSSDSLALQLAKQDELIARLHEVRLCDGTTLRQKHHHALIPETHPEYVKTLMDLTLSVAAAELKLAGFKVEQEKADELAHMVDDMVQNYFSSGQIPDLPPKLRAKKQKSQAKSEAKSEPSADDIFDLASERSKLEEELRDNYGVYTATPRYQAKLRADLPPKRRGKHALAAAPQVAVVDPEDILSDYAARFDLEPKPHLERVQQDSVSILQPMALGAKRAIAQASDKGAWLDLPEYVSLGGAKAHAKAQVKEESVLGDRAPFAAEVRADDAVAAQAQAEMRAARSAHKGMGALEAGELEDSGFTGGSFLAQAMSEGLKALQASAKSKEQADSIAAAKAVIESLPLSFSEKAKGIIAIALNSALSVLPVPKVPQDKIQQAEDRAVLAQLFSEHQDWINGLTYDNKVTINPDFSHRTLAWSNPEGNALTPQVAALCTKYVAPVVKRVLCQNEERCYTLSRIVDLKALFDLSIRGAKVNELLFKQGYQHEMALIASDLYGLSYNRTLINLVLYGFGPLGSLSLLKEDFVPSISPVKTLKEIESGHAVVRLSATQVQDDKAVDPKARITEWRHKILHKLKSQLSAQYSSAEVEAKLARKRPISLLDCLSAYYDDRRAAGFKVKANLDELTKAEPAKLAQFWAHCDLGRARALEQLLLNVKESRELGFNSGILEQEMMDLGRLSEESLGLCLVPSPALICSRFSFKLLRPYYQQVRFIVIPPELLVTPQGHEFYLRLKATLYYAYLGLELSAAVTGLKHYEGLVRLLARYIVTLFASQGEYQVERLVLEYLQGAVNVILADGPLHYDDLMLRTLHLYGGNDINSLNLHLDHIQQLQRFFALTASYELSQKQVERQAQLRYINLLTRLSLTVAPTSDCHHKAQQVASMISTYFFDPSANENLLRTGIFFNLKTYRMPAQLVLDANKIRSKLMESAQVQDVITKLREEESGVDESGPSLGETLAQKLSAQLAESKLKAQAPAQGAKLSSKEKSAPHEASAKKSTKSKAAAPQVSAAQAAKYPVAELNPKLHKVIEALAVQATDAMVYGEFNGICVSYGLLSGNYAIEVLNEFSYEHFDEPLLELDGSGNNAIIYLSLDLIAKLHEQCRKLAAS